MTHNNLSQNNNLIDNSYFHTLTDIQTENSSNINYNTSYRGYSMMNLPTSYEDSTFVSQQSGTGFNDSTQFMTDINNSQLYPTTISSHNTSTQPFMTGFDTSTQLYPAMAPQFNDQLIPQLNYENNHNPPPSANNIPSLNTLQSQIFRFKIPGFRIIIVSDTSPIEQDVLFVDNNSSSNIININE